MRRLRIAIAAIALGTVAAVAPVSADSSGPPTTGVWWQAEPSDGAVPPTNDVPAGGLWFSSGPNGETAVSALRFEISADVLPATLTLRVHKDQSLPAAGALDACPAAAVWTAPTASPGVFGKRAMPNCQRARLRGVVGNAGTTLTFDLRPLGASRSVDLVLTAPATSDATFIDTTFERPLARDISTVPVVSAGAQQDPVAPPRDEAFSADVTAPSFSNAPVDLGFNATPTVPSAPQPTVPRALPRPRPVAVGATSARDGAWYVALGALVLLVFVLWIAAIVSRRLTAGAGADHSTFTLYRGVPPKP